MNTKVSSRREIVVAGLALLALTFALRGWIFGDPVVNMDEQFYLLVGKRLALGHLPYVDIWDRKPFGLFAIYAAACRLFADPVTGYQLLAAAAVTLTSWVIFAMTRRLTGFSAALAGAAAYPAWLLVFGGVGGQSPVFYNLPMATAAALIARRAAQPDSRTLTRWGCLAMLLVGLAIQIKYTALFEGIFFGLSLMWIAWKAGRPPVRIVFDASLWVVAAWAPTLAAWAAYAALGHGTVFAQANFFSVLSDSDHALPAIERLAALTFGLFPLWICLWIAWRRWRGVVGPAANEARWLLAWSCAAYLGFLPLGVWNDHYVLPLISPLAATAALAFDATSRRKLLIAMVVGLGLAGGLGRAIVDFGINGNAAQVQRISALVRAQLHGRCLYVNEDLSILYYEVPSCLPTHYIFPQHLALARYAKGLGVDQIGELKRLLDSRPGVIVISADPDPQTSPISRRVLLQRLHAYYRIAGQEIVGETPYEVWVPKAG